LGRGASPEPRRGASSPRTPQCSLAVWCTTPQGDCRCWRAETEAHERQKAGSRRNPLPPGLMPGKAVFGVRHLSGCGGQLQTPRCSPAVQEGWPQESGTGVSPVFPLPTRKTGPAPNPAGEPRLPQTPRGGFGAPMWDRARNPEPEEQAPREHVPYPRATGRRFAIPPFAANGTGSDA